MIELTIKTDQPNELIEIIEGLGNSSGYEMEDMMHNDLVAQIENMEVGNNKLQDVIIELKKDLDREMTISNGKEQIIQDLRNEITALNLTIENLKTK